MQQVRDLAQYIFKTVRKRFGLRIMAVFNTAFNLEPNEIIGNCMKK